MVGAAQLALRSGSSYWNGVKGVVLVVSHYLIASFADYAIYQEIPDSHPYVTGLSIVLGLYAFDLQGAFIGPMLVCVPVIIYKTYAEFMSHDPATR